MKRILFFITAAIITLVSCDDTTGTIGTSLISNVDAIAVDAHDFNIISKSVKAENIVSRSASGHLGMIKDSETGAYIASNFMTQLHSMGKEQFPQLSQIYVDETASDYDPTKSKAENVKATYCRLNVLFYKYYGDSLALMKVTAHEMKEPYSEDVTYYTDFDPKANGMIRYGEGSIHEEIAYTVSNYTQTSTERTSSNYVPYFSIPFSKEYTDKDNVKYNNYGTYLMRKFFDSKTSTAFDKNYYFLHDICPGFYLEQTGGIGNIINIAMTELEVGFQYIEQSNGKDTIVGRSASFAGTEEVLQKTMLTQNDWVLDSLVTKDNSCTYLKTPAGIYTELELPISEILDGHENDTLNTARIFIPRINDNSTNAYKLEIPKTLLMLSTDSVKTFFANKKVADFRESYVTTYSSNNNGYTFPNVSVLLAKIYKQYKDSGLTKEEYIAQHPNWNKVMLIPVETTYSSLGDSQILTAVTHDMGLKSTRLSKDNLKVSVIYSKFKE